MTPVNRRHDTAAHLAGAVATIARQAWRVTLRPSW